MANQFSMTFSPDGSESSKSLNEAMAEKPESAPAEPIHREGGVVHRLQMREDGSSDLSVVRRGPVGAPAESNDPLDSATLNGMRVPRARLTEKAMLDYPRLGGSMPLSQAVDFGWLKKNADGSYSWAGEMADLATAPAVAAANDQKAADGDISMIGVEGTKSTTDMAVKLLRRDAGETVANGLTQAVIAGKDPAAFIADISRRSGQSEAEIRQAVDAVTADYSRAAKQVAVANGLRPGDASWDMFTAWVSENQAQAGHDALTRFVDDHEAGPLARLVRQYSRSGAAQSAYTDAEILSANFGSGIKAVQTEKGVLLDIPNHGRMTLKAAMARGIVRVS